MSPPGSVVEPAFFFSVVEPAFFFSVVELAFFSVVELVETTHQTPAAADL
jgi:hypothetical protein